MIKCGFWENQTCIAAKKKKIITRATMATDMTSALREFARKKLTEAKQKGATLATATAASISSNVPTSTSFVFRSQTVAAQQTQNPKEDVSLEKKLDALSTSLFIVRSSCIMTH